MGESALVAAILVLAFVCLLLAAWGLGLRPLFVGGAGGPGPPPGRGRRAPDPTRSPHLVVDALNLTHWRLSRPGAKVATLTPELIAETIDVTAPALKLRHSGRVYYVLKDRESQFNSDEARAAYRAAASRNGVYVSVAERYPDPPVGVRPSAEHSSRGRDDFYMSLLAYRHRCAVLTADRLKDFSRFRATIPPFHVVEYAFWRALPLREFIRPDAAAYSRVRKPRTIHPATYFAE